MSFLQKSSSKTRVFVTRAIPDEGIIMLKNKKGIILDIYARNQRIPRKELLKRVRRADIVLSLLTDRIDSEVMDAAGPQLKMIANYAVGFDNIDLSAAKNRNIIVTNTSAPEVSQAVAEHAAALLLALIHRIPESDAFTRKGKYTGWEPNLFLGTTIIGKTLGIIGAGAIGTFFAQYMHKGFAMRILYADTHPNFQLEKTCGAIFVKQQTLLEESDVISLHTPLTKATHHLLSTPQFKLMKKTAVLINTARGAIIDEKALLKALVQKTIAGAALDVYECEPHIDCDTTDMLALQKLNNVILTPHIGSATLEARQAMSRVVAKNIISFLEDNTPKNMLQ